MPTQALKKLSFLGRDYLVEIINSINCLRYYPNEWKCAKVIPIPKPGKPSYLVSSYRPISLLSTISKLIEKIIAIRFDRFVQENSILPPEQFGFRNNHSTVAQLGRVVDDIVDGFNVKKHCGMLTIDIEKAFDCVWIKGLLYKLITLKFAPYIIYLIHTYLADRYFHVFINNTYSIKRK